MGHRFAWFQLSRINHSHKESETMTGKAKIDKRKTAETFTRGHIGKLAVAMALTCVATGSPHAVHAQTYYSASPRVTLNGQPLATSVAPLVRSGRTLVPMRDIFEALGATVVWDGATREIRAQKADKNIWLQIGNRTARVDNASRWLEEAPAIYRGSTLVPLRFVSEALGADVAWDNSSRVVSILTSDRVASTNVGNTATTTTNTDVRGTLTIPAGAVVPVSLDQTISSKTARVGDTFTATVRSTQPGDSEFPTGTKLRGRITDVRPMSSGNPGILDLQFTDAILPDGTNVAINGALISLDDDSVTQTGGRIMAKNSSGGGADLKIIGIGAAAGYVLGRVLNKNSIVTGILGAAGGYLYSRSRDKGKEQDAVVNAGSTLGVRLTRSVTYTDAAYYDQRSPYLSNS
jgi:hypothetical protein